MEVKYGLLQLSEALSFLHSDVKMIHGNLTPSNVFVNRDGAWKVAGEFNHDLFRGRLILLSIVIVVFCRDVGKFTGL